MHFAEMDAAAAGDMDIVHAPYRSSSRLTWYRERLSAALDKLEATFPTTTLVWYVSAQRSELMRPGGEVTTCCAGNIMCPARATRNSCKSPTRSLAGDGGDGRSTSSAACCAVIRIVRPARRGRADRAKTSKTVFIQANSSPGCSATACSGACATRIVLYLASSHFVDRQTMHMVGSIRPAASDPATDRPSRLSAGRPSSTDGSRRQGPLP